MIKSNGKWRHGLFPSNDTFQHRNDVWWSVQKQEWEVAIFCVDHAVGSLYRCLIVPLWPWKWRSEIHIRRKNALPSPISLSIAILIPKSSFSFWHPFYLIFLTLWRSYLSLHNCWLSWLMWQWYLTIWYSNLVPEGTIESRPTLIFHAWRVCVVGTAWRSVQTLRSSRPLLIHSADWWDVVLATECAPGRDNLIILCLNTGELLLNFFWCL